MPDEIQEPTTASDETYSAADALAETSEIDNDEEKPEPEPETEESDTETADEVVEEDEEEEQGTEDEEDLPLSAKLKLDDNVREKFPEEAKRFDQQVKGLEKLDKRLKENSDALGFWEGVDNSLSQSKESAALTLKRLAEHVAKTHGSTVEDLLGAPVETGDAESKYGLAYASDDKILELAVNQAIEAVQKNLGVDPELLKELKEDADRRKAADADKEWLAGRGKTVIAKALKLENWPVTPEMVLDAKREFPELMKTDPVKALKKAHPEAYADSRKTKGRSYPDMTESATAKGPVIPSDPEEYSARHALAELGN